MKNILFIAVVALVAASCSKKNPKQLVRCTCVDSGYTEYTEVFSSDPSQKLDKGDTIARGRMTWRVDSVITEVKPVILKGRTSEGYAISRPDWAGYKKGDNLPNTLYSLYMRVDSVIVE